MPTREQPEARTTSPSMSVPARDWFQQFVKHLEHNFVELAEVLPPDPDWRQLQINTLRAVVGTLRDSGLESDALKGILGEVAMEQDSISIAWTGELNQRRFALIDREIQGEITPAERIELAGLTQIMRQHLDSETNLPLAGAKRLHHKLINMSATDDSR